MAKYIVTYEIKTDYDIEEVEEVIEKVFSIPGLQYEDCEKFEYKKICIKRVVIKMEMEDY